MTGEAGRSSSPADLKTTNWHARLPAASSSTDRLNLKAGRAIRILRSAVTSTAPNHTIRTAQHTHVSQIECPQSAFDAVTEPYNAMLYIGAEKRDKRVA